MHKKYKNSEIYLEQLHTGMNLPPFTGNVKSCSTEPGGLDLCRHLVSLPRSCGPPQGGHKRNWQHCCFWSHAAHLVVVECRHSRRQIAHILDRNGKYEISNGGTRSRYPPFDIFFGDTEHVQHVKYVIICTALPVSALPQLWTCSPEAQQWYWFYFHCVTKHNQCCRVQDCVCVDHRQKKWETSSHNRPNTTSAPSTRALSVLPRGPTASNDTQGWRWSPCSHQLPGRWARYMI